MKPSFVSQAIITGSRRRSENEAASIGTLALFQEQVKLLSCMLKLQLVAFPDPLTREPD